MNRPSIDAAVMRPSTFVLVIALGLAGCGASASNAESAQGSASRMEGPACYRDAKSNYEAAATGPDPNAALMNIGAALTATDDAFAHCDPEPDLKRTK